MVLHPRRPHLEVLVILFVLLLVRARLEVLVVVRVAAPHELGEDVGVREAARGARASLRDLEILDRDALGLEELEQVAPL